MKIASSKMRVFLGIAFFSVVAFLFSPAYFFLIGWAWPGFSGYRLLIILLATFLIPFLFSFAPQKIFDLSGGVACAICIFFFFVMIVQSWTFPNSLSFALGIRERLVPFVADISSSMKKSDSNESLKKVMRDFLSPGKNDEFWLFVDPPHLGEDGGRMFAWENEMFRFNVILTKSSNVEENWSEYPFFSVADDIYIAIEQGGR